MFIVSYLSAVLCAASVFGQDLLPLVDLSYQIHRAISFNITGQTYNFTNIRYAQPPIGDLRFAAPVAPIGRNPVVQNGSVGRVCPQVNPAWAAVAFNFTTAYLEHKMPYNFTAAVAELEPSGEPVPPQDPRTTEDCLFLDVIVPKAVYDKSGNASSKGAAVIIWIFGGGYTYGDKQSSGNPSGLIAASQATGNDGIIFVEFNYRLGALGWMAGPSLQSSNGVSNAGLYDQRLAIEWVQKYIHLFGGDPGRITLLGESAGGGSVMYQITAYGGNKPVPFQQAIAQSPGLGALPDIVGVENTMQTFLEILGVKSVAEARQLPSSEIIAANAKQIFHTTYGQYVYGPSVDGSFVPDLPGLLLLEGRHAKNLTVMVGHNADEGLYFTDPRITTDAALDAYLKLLFPTIDSITQKYITTVLYPPIYNGSYGYTSSLMRTILINADAIFTCNTNCLDRAFGDKTYAYEFSVPPAYHSLDVPYTFYNGPSPAVIAPAIAIALQAYLTNFAMAGNPNGEGVPHFKAYGEGASEQNLNITGIAPKRDETASARCLWWQQAHYLHRGI